MADNSLLKDILMFATGVAASVGTHEGGHMEQAKREGLKLDWHGLKATSIGPMSDEYKMAGLGAQAEATEKILNSDKPFSSYDLGMLAANTFEEITYPTIRNGTLDFKGLKNPGFYRAAFLAHSASVLGRILWQDKEDNVKVGFQPSKDGAMLTLSFKW